jgi:hypothetical protein
MKLEDIWDEIVDLEIATKDELILVTTINGYNEETLNDVLFVKTGYRSIEQLKEATRGL